MRYGHFDDDAKEYVIERPDTPRSWSNYLGDMIYGAIITNNAGGYSFYRSATHGCLTRLQLNRVPRDQPGRYFYLRDRADGDYWSASWQPVGKDLSEYKSICRHGTAYTVIESEYSAIRTAATYFVPLDRRFEYWILEVTNTGDEARELSVFPFAEFTNNWNNRQDQFNLQYSQYIVRVDWIDEILQCAVNHHLPPDPDDFENNDQCRHSFMAMTGADIVACDGDREAFIGPYRTYANPIVVEEGRCTGSLADGDNAAGVLQADLHLEPGESRTLIVLLGPGRADEVGRAVVEDFGSPERAEQELAKLKEHWHGRLGRLAVSTPDDDFDSMINVWGAYNSLVTYAWSREASLVYSGGRCLGYRDTVQDLVAAATLMGEGMRERLDLMITGQASTGGAKRIVSPWNHNPGHEATPQSYRSDDCMWLFNAVPAYVKETGDMGFYDKVLPYADAGEDTVLGHLRRAIEFNLERRGAHGLSCGLDADWNDCLCLGYRGETVFVAMQLRLALATYGDICDRLAREEEAAWAREQLEELDANLQQHTWDGNWFVRAFREDGSVIGSRENEEGAIFLNPQSWAVISGAADDEQARSAMDSVHEHLATEYGIAICDPPFEETDYHVVRAVLFNSGMKENAGIFQHPQGWAIMAECMLGRGNRAYEYFRAYMPSAYNDRADLREVEPYVYAQSTHGKYSRRFGKSRCPWLSGTATWSYHAPTQYILGIRPDYDGLRIDPCLPAEWEDIRVTRLFRGKRFEITIHNGPKGHGLKSLRLNGEPVEGNLLPIKQCAAENTVEVELK